MVPPQNVKIENVVKIIWCFSPLKGEIKNWSGWNL